MVVLAELLNDRPDRMDCVSDAAWSSDRSDRWGALNEGDADCVSGAGVGNVVAVDAEPEPAEGNGGASPILCNSGAAGLGTKIVLRTSRRPRKVDARFGGAACCCIVRSCLPHKVGCSYRAQGVDHIRHSSVHITILFLDRRVSDIQLELRGGVTLGLRTALWSAIITSCKAKFTYNPASRSASVMASIVDGGTENPSASFSGYECQDCVTRL